MASASHLRLRATPAEICAFGAVEDFRLEDLRSEIYPQSGPNCEIEVDIDTVAADEAVGVDKCSEVRTAAGRPQQPPAFSIVAFACSLRKAINGSLALKRTVRNKVLRNKVLIHLGNAKEENFVGRIVAG